VLEDAFGLPSRPGRLAPSNEPDLAFAAARASAQSTDDLTDLVEPEATTSPRSTGAPAAPEERGIELPLDETKVRVTFGTRSDDRRQVRPRILGTSDNTGRDVAAIRRRLAASRTRMQLDATEPLTSVAAGAPATTLAT
jgi:hypothetical protein